MEDLEKRKKSLEISRVRLAKDELEYKLAERHEEIRRLSEHIKIQEDKLKELEKDL